MRRLIGFALAAATLVACGGKAEISAPDVVGMRLDRAQAILKAAGLGSNSTRNDFSAKWVDPKANWFVCDQSPDAGTRTSKKLLLFVEPECPVEDLSEATDDTNSGDAPGGDPSAAAAVSSYVGGFIGTSWQPLIRGIKIVGSTVWVETSISASGESSEAASAVCRGVSTFVYSTSNVYGLTGVTVRSADGQRLVLRSDISDPC